MIPQENYADLGHQMRRVLMLSYAFPPALAVGGRRIESFCRHLPAVGWVPTVIAGPLEDRPRSGWTTWNGTDIFRTGKYPSLLRRRATPVRSRNHAPAQPSAAQPAAPGSHGRLRRVKRDLLGMIATPDKHIGWVPFAVAAALRMPGRKAVEAILTSSPPHSTHLAGVILSKILRRPLIVDLRDLWTLHEYAKELWRTPRAAEWSATLERLVFRHAFRIIANTPTAEAMLREAYPSVSAKVTTISNGFEPEEFEQIVPREFSKFTVTHAGSLYVDRNPRCFLDGLARWLSRDVNHALRNNLQVLFVGRVDPSLLRWISEFGLDGVVSVHSSVPRSELYPILAGSDALLLLLGFRPTSRYVMQAKLYEYLAVGRPIVALVPEGEMSSLLRSRPYHTVLTEEDPEAVVDILESLYANRHTLHAESEKPRACIADWPHFWWSNLTRQLGDVLASVSGSSHCHSSRTSGKPLPPEPLPSLKTGSSDRAERQRG
jgi:glycosyltransferase involved in cell wall biosynthesis